MDDNSTAFDELEIALETGVIPGGLESYVAAYRRMERYADEARIERNRTLNRCMQLLAGADPAVIERVKRILSVP
jgi:hypothetical protein